MDKYRCIACGIIYDPATGDDRVENEANSAFADLPDDWVCPFCGVGKDMFKMIQ